MEDVKLPNSTGDHVGAGFLFYYSEKLSPFQLNHTIHLLPNAASVTGNIQKIL